MPQWQGLALRLMMLDFARCTFCRLRGNSRWSAEIMTSTLIACGHVPWSIPSAPAPQHGRWQQPRFGRIEPVAQVHVEREQATSR